MTRLPSRKSALDKAVEAASWAETFEHGRIGTEIARAAVTDAYPVIVAEIVEALRNLAVLRPSPSQQGMEAAADFIEREFGS